MVIWSQPARADLRSIHDFIARDSCFYAKKVVQDIREKTDYSYRIIYKIREQGIFVLAVAHKRRELKAEDIER